MIIARHSCLNSLLPSCVFSSSFPLNLHSLPHALLPSVLYLVASEDLAVPSYDDGAVDGDTQFIQAIEVFHAGIVDVHQPNPWTGFHAACVYVRERGREMGVESGCLYGPNIE